jgi:hypothetical protein
LTFWFRSSHIFEEFKSWTSNSTIDIPSIKMHEEFIPKQPHDLAILQPRLCAMRRLVLFQLQNMQAAFSSGGCLFHSAIRTSSTKFRVSPNVSYHFWIMQKSTKKRTLNFTSIKSMCKSLGTSQPYVPNVQYGKQNSTLYDRILK